jgi:hypothetical protein
MTQFKAPGLIEALLRESARIARVGCFSTQSTYYRRLIVTRKSQKVDFCRSLGRWRTARLRRETVIQIETI